MRSSEVDGDVDLFRVTLKDWPGLPAINSVGGQFFPRKLESAIKNDQKGTFKNNCSAQFSKTVVVAKH